MSFNPVMMIGGNIRYLMALICGRGNVAEMQSYAAMWETYLLLLAGETIIVKIIMIIRISDDHCQ